MVNIMIILTRWDFNVSTHAPVTYYFFLRSLVIRWFDVDIDHNSRRTIFLTCIPLLGWPINLWKGWGRHHERNTITRQLGYLRCFPSIILRAWKWKHSQVQVLQVQMRYGPVFKLTVCCETHFLTWQNNSKNRRIKKEKLSEIRLRLTFVQMLLNIQTVCLSFITPILILCFSSLFDVMLGTLWSYLVIIKYSNQLPDVTPLLLWDSGP